MIRALARLVWFVIRRGSVLAFSIGLLGAVIGVALCVPFVHPFKHEPMLTFLEILCVGGCAQLALVLGFETAFEPDPDETFGGLVRAIPGALVAALPGIGAWALVAELSAPAIDAFFTWRGARIEQVARLVVGLPFCIAWCFYGLLPFASALRRRRGLLDALGIAGRIRREHRVGFLLASCVPFFAFYLTGPEIIAAAETHKAACDTTLGTIRVLSAGLSALLAVVVGPAGAVAAQALLERVAAPPTASPSPS